VERWGPLAAYAYRHGMDTWGLAKATAVLVRMNAGEDVLRYMGFPCAAHGDCSCLKTVRF
jgi:hypothetical protein